MTKIAFIGAGSFGFTRNLVRDILSFPALADATIALMDIDSDRLAAIKKAVDRIVAVGGYPAGSSPHRTGWKPCAVRTAWCADLQAGVTKAINQIIAGRDGFKSILTKNIEAVISADDDLDTADIDTKLNALQDEIMQLASSKFGYDNLAAEIHKLRSIKQDTQEHNAQRQNKRQRVAEMAEFLDIQSGLLTEYDDRLTRQLIERITLFDDRLAVVFKSGVEIDIEN